MNKHYSLFLLSILFISIKSFAQDELLDNRRVQTKKDTKIYNVQSLEDKSVKVKVIPDYVNNVLCVCYLTDTLKVFDYWDVAPENTYLSRQFLKINYEVRGGSNLGLGNTLIICVSNNKLYEALHTLQYTNWDSGFLIKTYNINFNLGGTNNEHVLVASIRDKSISTNEPETNYNYANISRLHFDKSLKVFYSIKDGLYDTLNVCYPNLTYKRIIQGNFPKVILEKEQYVFIGNQWFELSKNALVKY